MYKEYFTIIKASSDAFSFSIKLRYDRIVNMKKQLPMHTVSAAGFIINDNKLLIVHNPLKGWETPGGIIQEGESVLEGLKREVFEEVRLDVNVLELSSVMSVVNKQKGYNGVDEIQPLIVFDFICTTHDTNIFLSEEHDDFMWIEIDKAKEIMKKDMIARFECMMNKEIDFLKVNKFSTVTVLEHNKLGG